MTESCYALGVMAGALIVTDSVVVPESDLQWTASRASGPGGQHVQKTATKVELRMDLEGTSALSDAVKQRLRALASARLDCNGYIVVTSQRTRSQADNLEDARVKLADLIRRALRSPKPRRPTRPTAGSRRRRLDAKRRRSDKKEARSKRAWS